MMNARIVFVCLLTLLAHVIRAQNSTAIRILVVNGINNNPIENVHITEKNSVTGGVTSSSGFCSLKIDNLPTVLEFTHVSYDAVRITLQEANDDTLWVSMIPKSIDLEAVSVYAGRIGAYRQPDYVIEDFELLGDQILILQRNKQSMMEFRLLLTNDVFDTQIISALPSHIEPLHFFKDCLEQCHIVTSDSVYQVVKSDTALFIDNPMEKSRFSTIMSDCLFSLGEQVYFQRIENKGYTYEFYSVNDKTKEVHHLVKSIDTDRYNDLQASLAFTYKHPPLYTPFGIALYFDKKFMYKPLKQFLIKLDDSIYYFNHQQSLLEVISSDGVRCRSAKIDYHSNYGWNGEMIVDYGEQEVYTLVHDDLYKIDRKGGGIDFKIKAMLFEKIRVYRSNAFLLKKRITPMGTIETYIDRIKL